MTGVTKDRLAEDYFCSIRDSVKYATVARGRAQLVSQVTF